MYQIIFKSLIDKLEVMQENKAMTVIDYLGYKERYSAVLIIKLVND